MKLYRFLVGISALPIILLVRVNMGYNLIGEWHNKPFGEGPGKYSTTWYGRIWFLFLTTLWIFGFSILSFAEAAFEKPEIAKLGGVLGFFEIGVAILFEGNIRDFFEYVFEFLGDIPIVYFACLMLVYAFMFPILGIAFLISIDRAHCNNERLSPTSLGDSLLFGWFFSDHQDSKYALLSLYEPLFFIAISGLFFLAEAIFPCLFFGLAGIGMFIQGQQKRMSYRKTLDELNANLDKGKNIIKKEQGIKQAQEHPGSLRGKESPGAGAQPL